ncbi:MAG: DUF1553 domain-containing protein [Planctomycetes bacterium]|nr:DUF1553 domain-containing protein [Planctomycetota bacterium]
MLRTVAVLAAVLAPSAARAADVPASFRTDVVAALSRVGCNSGACHGSPQGKNGFRLSLRGQDPDLDFATLTKEVGGRRVNRQSPDDSLVLLKGAGRVAHGGGQLFGRDGTAYRIVARWIAEGAKDDRPPALVKLEVTPAVRRLDPTNPSVQLVAKAHFADGTSRDVTALTVFTTNEPAKVTPEGRVTFARTGEASVLARYLTAFTSARFTFVQPDTQFRFRTPPANNFIDAAVFAKQKELQLLPAAVCSDEVFLRRVYLDTVGTLPAPEEAAAFLDSKDKDKRAKLIDALLEREEFAYFWALKWADVLRGSPTTISERGVHSFHRYLVRSVADDKPITQLARELITGSGNTLHRPAANFYRVARTPEDAAEATAQLFLGVRVQCAKCHSHPFENITQTDYYGLAAFFARVQLKGAQFGLDDEVVYTQPNRELNNPVTRKPQQPIAFGWVAPAIGPDGDRRDSLADWLTDPKNPFFAKSITNRVWFHLMGKGIVDPVDDFRDTNPPSNPELLSALAEHFAKGGYRLKPLVRAVLNSHTYQLASEAPEQSPFAADPERYFVKANVRMLAAEQILDAVSGATGVPERFKGYPVGTRAIALPEGGVNHPFLMAFSKPARDVICECAREEDPALPQVLHMLNNAGVLAKVKSPNGRIAGWLKAGKDDAWIVEHVYLATLCRRPTAREKELVTKHLAGVNDRAAGLQDVQHALLNLNEFLLRH